MPFSSSLKYLQVLLAAAAEAWGCNDDKLFVDVPVNEQLSLSGLDMLKFALQVDTYMGYPLPVGMLQSNMTLNQMSEFLSEHHEQSNNELKIA